MIEETLEAPPTYHSVSVTRWKEGAFEQAMDFVADEVPVAMVYNGISHAVMLATPDSLEAFGLGFSLTEAIIADASELYEVEVVNHPQGIEIQMSISQLRFAALKEKRRSMAGRTGCGLCGAENLSHVVRHPPKVARIPTVAAEAIHRAFRQLSEKQHIQAVTGAVHAAAWSTLDGNVHYVKEDVGRHNALDKLIGTLAKDRIDPQTGFSIVTSRASYEMVQKSASYGIAMLAAISAPTGLAIQLAEETGLTLIGFTRQDKHVIYTTPNTLVG